MPKRNDYISWDEYFMGIALLSARRSKDPSTQVGACIVNDRNKIMSVGYNGFPQGCSDDDFPWERSGDEFETKYASYDFITHNVEVVDGELVETYTFKNVSDHVKDLQNLGLLTGDNMITLYVSLEQSRTQLLAQGFTEVE